MITAYYNEPEYDHYRKLVGINTYASRRRPAGYKRIYVRASDEHDLKMRISERTYYLHHDDNEGRKMKLTDLTIVERT
ncbi:hypothetical protein CMI37_08610 [Candidatus Pacearchaeota archaeon]|nr:hypothetical protein [Candidatus Pacearchaeota archaeon]|tara:strand:- start:151 stop:384 length:234 start_codon:yes stop_codon:yes gene_type:complete